MKSQTGMRFPCEQNLPEAKRINVNSLDIAFNKHVRLKLIAIILTEIKSAYACLSKHQIVLKCSRNEKSCDQNRTGMSSFQSCFVLKINRRADAIVANI